MKRPLRNLLLFLFPPRFQRDYGVEWRELAQSRPFSRGVPYRDRKLEPAGLLFGLSLTASYLPARKAGSVAPKKILREE